MRYSVGDRIVVVHWGSKNGMQGLVVSNPKNEKSFIHVKWDEPGLGGIDGTSFINRWCIRKITPMRFRKQINKHNFYE